MKKKIFIISAMMLLYLAACNNTDNSKEDIESNNSETDETNEIVKVGIYVYDSPFVYLYNGKISGFDYDLINKIADVVNLELKFIQMKFDELIPALQNGEIDCIVAGLSVTEERKKL